MSAPTTPVTDDANATAAALQQRAAQDLADAAEKQVQGCQRQGILPGGIR